MMFYGDYDGFDVNDDFDYDDYGYDDDDDDYWDEAQDEFLKRMTVNQNVLTHLPRQYCSQQAKRVSKKLREKQMIGLLFLKSSLIKKI